MSQYIKISDALRIVDLHYGPCSGYSEIKRLPAEDVEPVVHGRWLDTGFFNSYKTPIYECSVCHKEVYDYYINCHKYCLHCGARMDGE